MRLGFPSGSVALTGLVILTACGSDQALVVSEGTPAAAIFQAAEQELANNDPQDAADYLMEVERLYPFTPEAERALIGAARAYHSAGALVEARAAATRYLQFFPGAENAPLAQYLVALSYYDGIVDIGRDQSRTFEALQELQIVIERYPDTRYAELARPKFDIALNQLAGKEMEIGRYYLRNKHYTSAVGRFQAVLDEYPANPHQPEALLRLVESYLELGLRDEALRAFGRLNTIAPESSWAANARALLETGTQSNGGESIFRQVFMGDWI